MIENIGDGTLAGGAVALVGSAVWGILWLRKTFSSDSRSIGQDTAERDTMKFLIAERDKYMAMHQEAVIAARQTEILNERLAGKVETLTNDNARLALQVSRFELELKGMRKLLMAIAPERAAEIFNSNFASLDSSP